MFSSDSRLRLKLRSSNHRKHLVMSLKDRIRMKQHDFELQSDQNMMKPELSGINMNSSFEVSSYFGQSV